MNANIVTLSLVCVALLGGVIYLSIYNNTTPVELPPLLNETENTSPPIATSSSQDPTTDDESTAVDPTPTEAPFGPFATLGTAGFDPSELIVGEGAITVRNETNASVLIAPSGIDCATAPASCELIGSGEAIELTIFETTSFTTNTGHTLIVTVQ